MSEEKLTAYHEAGHVVVAWVLGLEMEGASVETQGDSAGRITLAETENIELYDELLRRRLVTSYAGVNAVKMYIGQPTAPDDPNVDPGSQGSDWDNISDLILRLADPEKSAQEALKKEAEEVAQHSLRDNWHAVEAVAETLLQSTATWMV